ncbi:uncharacterized protein LOC131245910 [Magnolia sinica]|uniref:uncharacterized protein LOC131245910 n=1 Tax=Magnolia sinica TaxID=86752 RepID=UPI00265A8A67|nr:uncharacterized protein LOC131245910 [Magnolia sinica]
MGIRESPPQLEVIRQGSGRLLKSIGLSSRLFSNAGRRDAMSWSFYKTRCSMVRSFDNFLKGLSSGEALSKLYVVIWLPTNDRGVCVVRRKESGAHIGQCPEKGRWCSLTMLLVYEQDGVSQPSLHSLLLCSRSLGQFPSSLQHVLGDAIIHRSSSIGMA